MITIYTLTFNEEILMQFMIDHYKSRFPNCKIIVYDNSSTDNTVQICKDNNCEVRTYDSGGTLNDRLHMDLKNSIWKDAETDWVLVSDLDELLDINETDLKNEEKAGATIIKAEGWQMVNMEDNLDVRNMKNGYRNN
ncbi:MAG: glycosyltransferase family 2 protein, partial [Nanoarchaeota archaeon]